MPPTTKPKPSDKPSKIIPAIINAVGEFARSNPGVLAGMVLGLFGLVVVVVVSWLLIGGPDVAQSIAAPIKASSAVVRESIDGLRGEVAVSVARLDSGFRQLDGSMRALAETLAAGERRANAQDDALTKVGAQLERLTASVDALAARVAKIEATGAHDESTPRDGPR